MPEVQQEPAQELLLDAEENASGKWILMLFLNFGRYISIKISKKSSDRK